MIPEPGSTGRGAFLGLPVSVLAALPACPACYPAYAGILSALGLGALANVGAQAAITVALLAGALVALLYRARSRRGLGPFWLGLGAAGVVIAAKFVVGIDAATYAGVGLLVAASVWNVWPRPRPSALHAPDMSEREART